MNSLTVGTRVQRARIAVRNLAQPALIPKRALSRALEEVRYERRLGTSTGGSHSLEELHLNPVDRVRYEPSSWRILRRILDPSEVDGSDVFLDLGSGKGRVVLQAAADYGFGKIIGVELAPALHALAESNLAAAAPRLPRRNVRLVCADAASFELPDDVTVVFMNNPFGGEVLRGALGQLLASLDRRPRRVRLIYAHPEHKRELLATERFQLVRRRRVVAPTQLRSTSLHLYETRSPRRASSR
ncbi:MAG: methyltransferase domain-containing protein [Solirubrobacteraceae bacterium]|nr:MAG: hypothetical protein DLM63_09065 [Solirubrobacterales bacterium]